MGVNVRLKKLLFSDMKFQYKYGFYMVYAILSILYLCVLETLPKAFREDAVILMILTDPAAMGLFFMGAIVLLEKSQRVLNSIAVSPVKAMEYVLAKAISISIISCLVAIILSLRVDGINMGNVIISTFFGAIFFSLLGMLVAIKVTSLNQFLIATVPFEIICFSPMIIYMFWYRSSWMILHPGCALVSIIQAERNSVMAFCSIVIWNILILPIAKRMVEKMFQQVGGVA